MAKKIDISADALKDEASKAAQAAIRKAWQNESADLMNEKPSAKDQDDDDDDDY